MDRKERVLGALAGTSLAESVGMISRGMSKRKFAKRFPDGPNRMFLPWGNLTGAAAEMSSMTMEALLSASDCKNFQSQLASRIKSLPFRAPVSTELATLVSSVKLLLSQPGKSGIRTQSCSAVYRAIVIGAWFGEDIEDHLDWVDQSTGITHRNASAFEGARLVAIAAGNHQDFFTVASEMASTKVWETALSRLANKEPLYQQKAGVPRKLVTKVALALELFLTSPRNIKVGVGQAVRLGGDAQSVCSIVGGLCGAISGYESMPDEWLDRMADPTFNIEKMVESNQVWSAGSLRRMIKIPLDLLGRFNQRVRLLAPPY